MKVAFVIQRYGVDVGGGSEFFCREIAERMSKHWDIEVLTSCATDYITWRDTHKPGLETVNGVKVRRFRVDFPRTLTFFDRIGKAVSSSELTCREVEEKWLREQGPYSSDFLQYLDDHQGQYDFFIFFTYLYGFTFFGLPRVAAKSILVPTAHEEPPFYLEPVRELFRLPRGFIFLTPEERDFVLSHASVDVPHDVVSIGIAPARPSAKTPSRQPTPYLLYLGRIDPSKGCPQMLSHFLRYRHSHPDAKIRLVLAGKAVMNVPEDPSIESIGYVDEAVKPALIAGASVLLMPSPYESLSLVTLEAWNHGVPVLVNGECAVLKGQVERSGGGKAYTNYREFERSLDDLLENEELRHTLGRQGQRYIQQNYRWEQVEETYLKWGARMMEGRK